MLICSSDGGFEGSPSPTASSKHAKSRWLCRCGAQNDTNANLCMVHRFVRSTRSTLIGVQEAYARTNWMLLRVEQRENDIAMANRDNVQRMLSSLAVYPFTEKLGYAIHTAMDPRILTCFIECRSRMSICSLLRLGWKPMTRRWRYGALIPRTSMLN